MKLYQTKVINEIFFKSLLINKLIRWCYIKLLTDNNIFLLNKK